MVRHSMRLRPINRTKHVIDLQFSVAIDTAVPQIIAIASDTTALATPGVVLTGSTINSIYLHVEATPTETDATSSANVYFMFYKNPASNMTFPKGNVMGSSDLKRFVLHQEMVMIQPIAGGQPRTVFNGVIKIPRHMRRMAPEDSFYIQLFTPSTGSTFDACVQAHYKEFR